MKCNGPSRSLRQSASSFAPEPAATSRPRSPAAAQGAQGSRDPGIPVAARWAPGQHEAQGPGSITRGVLSSAPSLAPGASRASPHVAQLSHGPVRRWGRDLYAGPRPHGEADMAVLAKLGVRRVVDIEDRWSAGPAKRRLEATEGRPLGIDVITVPISPLFPRRLRFEQVVDIIGNGRHGTTYLHCLEGRERTNLVIALHRVRFDGWQPEEAAAQMVPDGYRAELVPLLNLQRRRWLREDARPGAPRRRKA